MSPAEESGEGPLRRGGRADQPIWFIQEARVPPPRTRRKHAVLSLISETETEVGNTERARVSGV